MKAKKRKNSRGYLGKKSKEENENSGEGEDSEKMSPPKRVTNAYLYFCQDYRKVFKEVNPDLMVTEMTRMLSEHWRGCEEEEKNKYLNMNAADKERYERQKAEFDSTGKYEP